MASALAAFVLVLLLAGTLVFGLRVGFVARHPAALLSVLVEPPPSEHKQPKARPRRGERKAAKAAPAPRGPRNQATPVVAPRVTPLIVLPPIVVATQAGTGVGATSGASSGAGQGAGGAGNGSGGGGDGGDGSGGVAVEPRQIRGKLSFKDLPEGLLAPGHEARVGVRYVVEVDGSVRDCVADEPSGIPVLDSLACRLIEQRFRFRPARDRKGHPVRATIVEAHHWIRQDE
jgi:protein TonB